MTGGPLLDGGGVVDAATGCQSGFAKGPVPLSIVVTLPFTDAAIVARCPDESMKAIFVPSGA